MTGKTAINKLADRHGLNFSLGLNSPWSRFQFWSELSMVSTSLYVLTFPGLGLYLGLDAQPQSGSWSGF